MVAMFDWIEAQPDLGKIDICIANAGLSTPESLLDGRPIEDKNNQLIKNVVPSFL